MFENISIGLDKPIYFYDYGGRIRTLDEISGISSILHLDSDNLPVFYIYILIKDLDAIVGERRESLLINIGKSIGGQIKEKIMKELQSQIKQTEG